MAIKTYKPTTPSRRYMTNLDSGDITAKQVLEHYLKIFQDLQVETVTVELLLVTEKQVLKNYTES